MKGGIAFVTTAAERRAELHQLNLGFHIGSSSQALQENSAGSFGALYLYYKSKDELILAAFSSAFQEMRLLLAPILTREEPWCWPQAWDWRRLQAKGEDRLLGRGIFYGAARHEATSLVGKKVFIEGGGNSAGQAAMFLSSYSAEVKVLVRGEGLKLSMSQYLIDQIASKANIQVLPFTQIVSVDGEDRLERIEARVQAPHEMEKILGYEADALFVMIGADPNTSWLPSELERDPRGYICTGRDLTTWKLDRHLFPLETSLPGVFCAGDVRHNSIKRVDLLVLGPQRKIFSMNATSETE